tara:strand:+ start:733 stop:864 length:132 start_codon:yes stop_codon:yes gene_type:complete
MKKEYNDVQLLVGFFVGVTAWTFFLMLNYAWLKLVIKIIDFVF